MRIGLNLKAMEPFHMSIKHVLKKSRRHALVFLIVPMLSIANTQRFPRLFLTRQTPVLLDRHLNIATRICIPKTIHSITLTPFPTGINQAIQSFNFRTHSNA